MTRTTQLIPDTCAKCGKGFPLNTPKENIFAGPCGHMMHKTDQCRDHLRKCPKEGCGKPLTDRVQVQTTGDRLLAYASWIGTGLGVIVGGATAYLTNHFIESMKSS